MWRIHTFSQSILFFFSVLDFTVNVASRPPVQLAQGSLLTSPTYKRLISVVWCAPMIQPRALSPTTLSSNIIIPALTLWSILSTTPRWKCKISTHIIPVTVYEIFSVRTWTCCYMDSVSDHSDSKYSMAVVRYKGIGFFLIRLSQAKSWMPCSSLSAV